MTGTALSWRLTALAIGVVLLIQAVILHAMGHPPICTCGHVRLWYGDPAGPETSQQLTDWYSWTHLLHGLLFYALLRWLFPRAPLPLQLALAAGLEAGWELLENSPPVMARYRLQALARGYYGDSILNSLSDTVMALAGMALARRLPVRASIGIFVAVELWLAFTIRDNLILNVVQLAWPSQAVSDWQTRQ